MGNGNIDVGNKTATRKPGQPVESFVKRNGSPEPRIEAPNTVRTMRPGLCGAMSQQGCDSGNQSSPQKLVQLVGCRDPKARAEPWVRPSAIKR